MELFIAVIVIGVMAYEFYNGEIIVKNGASRAKGLSRKTNPGTFWFWIVIQAAIVVFMLLEWLNITNVGIFS